MKTITQEALSIVQFAFTYQHETLVVRLFDDGTWEVASGSDGDDLLIQQGYWGMGKPPFKLVSTEQSAEKK